MQISKHEISANGLFAIQKGLSASYLIENPVNIIDYYELCIMLDSFVSCSNSSNEDTK